jgi:hypothetical protein
MESPELARSLNARVPDSYHFEGFWEALGGAEASQRSFLALQDMSGNPLFGFMRNGEQSLEVIETE